MRRVPIVPSFRWVRRIVIDAANGSLERPPQPYGGDTEQARGINIHEDDLDEVQLVKWIRQAAAVPGGGKSQARSRPVCGPARR